MVTPASRRRLMVPGPESKSSLWGPISIRTEQGPRFRDGTQVPDPSMVMVNSFTFVLLGMADDFYRVCSIFQ